MEFERRDAEIEMKRNVPENVRRPGDSRNERGGFGGKGCVSLGAEPWLLTRIGENRGRK